MQSIPSTGNLDWEGDWGGGGGMTKKDMMKTLDYLLSERFPKAGWQILHISISLSKLTGHLGQFQI